MNAPITDVLNFRTIWISDIHLGTRGAQAELLLDFLKHTESKYLYLVGDIVDGWRMKRKWHWSQAHNDVVQKLLRKARKGTRLVYIPGNHDENFRDFAGRRFGNVVVMRDAVHRMADGRKFLVLHGDEFDGVVLYAKWLATLGDGAYELALSLNRWLNIARRKLWVESCTALVEHFDGRLEILHWAKLRGTNYLEQTPWTSSSSVTPGIRKSTASSEPSIS
jgi:UDP-2,3-diacylglucosamine pyrophosphatase LpxH